MSDETVALLERIEALEWALDNPEWRRLTQSAEQEFTRQGLRDITDLCRVMFLKNPIVKRGVAVKRFYVWGQGWTVEGSLMGQTQSEAGAQVKEAIDGNAVQDVIDDFLYDPKNDDVIGSHEARMQLEVELETDGNLFFCFFVNKATGRVRVRRIDFNQIEDVIRNPDDANDPWFYKRTWTEERFDVQTGSVAMVQHTAYYPDWRYTPTAKPNTIGGHPVHWDKPVYHVKIGGFSNWKFGLSEVYASIDWAAAYKNFLEDWASIVRAYRRFAFQLTTTGGSRAVAAARTKLATTLGTGTAETNPAPVTGSIFVGSEGQNLTPVRTSGATVSAEDGRRLLLMVAADSGLPETFYGDANIGSLATAKSLDRPTELMMEDRQQLWRDVFLNILNFIILWAVKAPQGALRSLGRIADEIEDGQHNERVEWNDEADAVLSVEFPPLLQHDIPQMVDATIKAATLGASGQLAGTIDLPTLSRMLLVLLGVPDAGEIVEKLFPNGDVPESEEPEQSEPAGDERMPERPQAEAMMVAAVKELRDSLVKLQEGVNGRVN